MKNSIFTVAIFALAMGTIFTSCNSPAEKVDDSKAKVENAQQDLDKAKREYAEEYNKFKLESDEKITANEKLIADLKEYSKKKKKEAKADYEKVVSDLEAKNQALKERVNAQKDATSEQWASFKDEFNHDMNEIGEAIKNVGKDNVK